MATAINEGTKPMTSEMRMPVHDTAQDIAPVIIGAERMLERGGDKLRSQVDFERVVGRNVLGKDGNKDEERHHRDAQHGLPVAHESASTRPSRNWTGARRFSLCAMSGRKRARASIVVRA